MNSASKRQGSFVPQALLDHLDIWTSAIETRSTAGRGSSNKLNLYGIKKLRELILELAVRGQLVPQDPADEPASVLLEKIAAEKAHLIKAGKLKKQQPLPSIADDEKPFELPEGWEWTRLGELCVLENGDRSKNYPNKSLLVDIGIPFVNAGHLQNGRVNRSEMTYITEERFDLLRSGKFRNGDILYCLRGSLGKSALVEGFDNGAIASSLVIVRLFSEINNHYVLHYFDSPFALALIKLYDNGTAQPNLSATDLGKFLFGVPPEAEQHRIVAKVNELMSLCDALEQAQESSINDHQRLVENLLAELTQKTPSPQPLSRQAGEGLREDTAVSCSPSPAQRERGLGGEGLPWQRIATHFDTLFTTEHSIDQLKQTILQLAVMGKLVPQDPTDEPASVLLEKIAAEKARLVKAGKLRKETPLPQIAEDEKPFELPSGWEWCRFGHVVNFRAELVRPEDFQEFDQVAPDLIEKGTGKLLGRRTVKESGVKGPNSRFYNGQILYSKIRPSLSKAIIAEFDGLCSADMYPLESLVDSHYLLKLILSESFLAQVRIAENRIKMPKLNIDSLSMIVIPLACLSGQQQIVAKVDELMALCDQLKAQISATQTTQLRLADALAGQVM
jgi:type I restriction enzyme S subunit